MVRWPGARRRPRPRRSRDASSTEPPLSLLLDGPWEHREVVANGFSFHVVVGTRHDELRAVGGRPLVLLLHGFVQFWWAWRHQLPVLDRAGHPVAALDLRGYGASDQPPRGYDLPTLARDVAGVVRGLGHRHAVIVGHDLGGSVGWATAAFVPDVLAGLVSVAAPAPGATRWSDRLSRWLPAGRWSARSGQRVESYLRSATAPTDPLSPDPLGSDALERYRSVLLAWPGPQRAVAAGRHSDRAVRRALAGRPAEVDLLSVRGALDRRVSRAAMDRADPFVTGQHTHAEVPGVAHLVPEEAPGEFSALLLDWLARRGN